MHTDTLLEQAQARLEETQIRLEEAQLLLARTNRAIATAEAALARSTVSLAKLDQLLQATKYTFPLHRPDPHMLVSTEIAPGVWLLPALAPQR